MSLALCGKKPLLASSSSDGAICLWDLDTQVLKASARLAVPVWSVAFCPCRNDEGKTVLASGALDRSVRLWELQDFGTNASLLEVADFRGDGPIRSLAVCDDGKLATASSDGTVRLWPTERENFETLLAEGKRLLNDPGI